MCIRDRFLPSRMFAGIKMVRLVRARSLTDASRALGMAISTGPKRVHRLRLILRRYQRIELRLSRGECSSIPNLFHQVHSLNLQGSNMKDDPFYVGYERKAPSPIARKVRVAVIVIA